jgi:2-amino-4-hydroxy-6-hydroxymethyldihydropteridine diphosphokinase
MAEVFVSVGSNIDRERNVVSALRSMEQAFGPLRVSSIYESDAVGFEGDPFYNLVVAFATELPVAEVAKRLALIEDQHGRDRQGKKFSARTIDLDLLLYGDEIVAEGRLQLPRAEITRYAFVLEPLAELAPNVQHPLTGLSYRQLWQQYDKTGLQQHRVELKARS